MSEICRLSIILPVYNEKESLSIMIKILEATLYFQYEILVVYDSPEDNSIEETQKLQRLFSNIVLVHNNLGKGVQNAVLKGIEVATSNVILVSAVDEVFPIAAISEMLDLVENKNCDFVNGTRYALGGKRLGGSFIGGILSKTANFIFRKLTGLLFTDATTGLKMFKKTIFDKITIESNPIGWAFAFELSIKAQLVGLRIGEVPLTSIDRLFGGQSTFKIGSWTKEYFRWFWWGIKNLYRVKKTQNKIITTEKNKN